MPLNTLRLNHQPSSHPNPLITFIKPLPRPESEKTAYETADLLLRAIAAQCLPIMKSHHLAITTLEEHEPNPEFIGRNFNNGEIVQLVLRSRSGAWLDVKMIQMVMMHELAHNMHMNHGRMFWQVRNGFAVEMRGLWAKGYTGEGFWGGGRVLGGLEGNLRSGLGVVGSEELKDLPVCGGTFRSRGRGRRKRKKGKEDGLTWKEKKNRRIEKKFGKNGVALGEDEDKRLMLEMNGKGPVGVKPRVAQSKRGRELRVAAALARFDTNKKEVDQLEAVKKENEETGSGSEDESEYEEVDSDAGQEDAKDANGQKLLDSKGHGMVKICGDEDQDNLDVKQEMEELEGLHLDSGSRSERNGDHTAKEVPKSLYDIPQHTEESKTVSGPNSHSFSTDTTSHNHRAHQPNSSLTAARRDSRLSPPPKSRSPSTPAPTTHTVPQKTQTLPAVTSATTSCPICSLTNPTLNATCAACSHVLDSKKDPRSWRCTSDACEGSAYLNPGDAGVCGICGGRRRDD